MTKRRETISYSLNTAVLGSVCVLALLAYVYFLNASVVHVVVQKAAMSDIQDLRTEIALLETQYIMAQHEVTARMATIEGVSAERDKIFVARDSGDSLVLNQ